MALVGEQMVSLHTYDGVQLDQYLSSDYSQLRWKREMRETSQCRLTAPSQIAYGRAPEIMPWLHWVSVWSDNPVSLQWTGPVLKTTTSRENVEIQARDVSAYLARTRCPISKTWDSVDAPTVAGQLWEAMAQEQGLESGATVRINPEGHRYEFEVEANDQMLDGVFDDLVNLGLKWTVAAGVPVLGRAPLEPLMTLGEHDFVSSGVKIVRDGSESYNDVLVRGDGANTHVRRSMGGLNLQKVINIDSVGGISNLNRAADQYAQYTSSIRDALQLGSTAALHPDANVSIDELVPSTRFVMDAYGVRTLMELESVEVSASAGNTKVSVGLESIDPERDKLELEELDTPFPTGG